MPPETITAECRNGHEHTYAGPAGRAVKCKTSTCRVSVWLKKGLPPPEGSGDGSVWADETPWTGQAEQAGEDAAEPCGECGSGQSWTPGRTALVCSECGTVSLPAAVREGAIERRPAARASTAVALTPEQEIDALIRFEARQNSTVSVLRKAADSLKAPADYLEDQQDRKNAANTASALRTLARLASEAKDTARLDLIEEKAVSLAITTRWLVARLEDESEEYEDDEDDYEDEPRALAPSSAIPAAVAPGTYVPAASIPRLSYATAENNAYARLAEERARKRRENEAARAAAGDCAGRHRTLGVFPYRPKVQYRLWKVEQQYSPYSWDGSGVPTFAGGYATSTNRTHVMDGCYSCMQKAAGDEPGMEYDKLWDGANKQMSMAPIGLLLVAGLALFVYMKTFGSYGYEGWGSSGQGYNRW